MLLWFIIYSHGVRGAIPDDQSDELYYLGGGYVYVKNPYVLMYIGICWQMVSNDYVVVR